MSGKIVLGWRVMRVVRCPDCGGWALAGPYGWRHVSGRVPPPAVCLGRRAPWPEDRLPAPPPGHKRRRWWEHVPPELITERPHPIHPDPHSPAWDYLPPAPAEGCSCGYYLAWSWEVAWDAAFLGRCDEILLYCQAIGPGILYEAGVRVEAFRILAFAPRWCGAEQGCPFAGPRMREVVRERWGPEIADPGALPTGVFGRIPPEVAALM